MKHNQRHLVVMAKTPRMGRVKSRLARDVGRVEAWAFYRRTLARTLRILDGDARWTTWLSVTPDAAALDDGVWPRPGVRKIGQGGGDLGRRMARIMASLPPGPAVIVGADIPEINRDAVWRAFRALGSADAVFGPATDGGYWLVGLKRRPNVAKIFDGVRWSTADALADTRANLPPGRWVAEVDVLNDVDDGDDYARWARVTAKLRADRWSADASIR